MIRKRNDGLQDEYIEQELDFEYDSDDEEAGSIAERTIRFKGQGNVVSYQF